MQLNVLIYQYLYEILQNMAKILIDQQMDLVDEEDKNKMNKY
jgi:hypothetical protein